MQNSKCPVVNRSNTQKYKLILTFEDENQTPYSLSVQMQVHYICLLASIVLKQSPGHHDDDCNSNKFNEIRCILEKIFITARK